MKKKVCLPFCIQALTCLMLVLNAQAVIIAGGDGTGNTDGTGVPGWEYVGKISHAHAHSGVTYVGDNWFVTAYHIQQLDNPSAILFNNSSYNIDSTSWARITNSVGTGTDLTLFRVNEPITGLANPVISSSTPVQHTAVTMIGTGRNRATDLTYWNILWNEVSNPNQAHYSGYKYASGSTKRWGNNTVGGATTIGGYGYGETITFYTVFDDIDGQAQGATYDSGGGVFIGTEENWELSGIMLMVGAHSGQPGSTAVFGNVTYVADLAPYRDQILQTIPEPSAVVLISIACGLICSIRRRFS